MANIACSLGALIVKLMQRKRISQLKMVQIIGYNNFLPFLD